MKIPVQLTTKSLGIDDLKNTDHVGWTDTLGRKCFTVQVDDKIRCVGEEIHYSCNLQYSTGGETIQQALKAIETGCNGSAQIKDIYRFDTRKELYQWLATD